MSPIQGWEVGSCTTTNDRGCGFCLIVPTLQKYFTYECYMRAGNPAGEDWVALLNKVDKLI